MSERKEGEDDASQVAGNSLPLRTAVTFNRKTGITVKDTGFRDEDGLELVEGLFSSPEKSSRRSNGITNNTTISSEEDMELVDSTLHQGTAVSVLRLPLRAARVWW